MSGYTKADFYALYRFPAVHPQLNYYFSNFGTPNLFGGQKITFILHYHPSVIKPSKVHKVSQIVDQFDSNDVVAIVGSAFNWLGEELEDQIGCVTYGVETSDWVHEVKSQSADDELLSAIEAQSYAGTEIGDYLFNTFTDTSPRSRLPERIVTSYNDIPETVTKIITEECWQILDQSTKDFYTSLNLPMIHFIDGEVI